ncbi:bacteriorhodopsin [Fibrella aquatilis]|uniref:Bacteriorhodopsin n=1 Tax=Fibrella aquatilis TaxID=2817059 RepID=A0A939K0M9_9BACT|nr:bacteriorhodopsin [Fibrella aquatilis]MBO0934359.1 bacteriorhodopsin [Fibrella aquatilis]
MEFDHQFLPLAGQVGMLPVVAWFFMFVAFYAFVGHFIFALATRNGVASIHRDSNTITAIIAAVAGISYYFIQDIYRHMLAQVAATDNPVAAALLQEGSFAAINQLRYIDWAVTTPLLLLKTGQMLRIRFTQAPGTIAILLLADLLMVITGYIGEQQVLADGAVLVDKKLFWGAISTVFYFVIPIILYRFWQRYRQQATPEEQRAFRLMALTSVTTWGIYPVGYVLSVLPNVDNNWIHLSFSVFDVINKVGVGIIAFMASANNEQPT